MCELRTKTERQREERIRGNEIAGGSGRDIVCFFTHQGHPELECDWKSLVCLCCLPHEIIQTGCSADNATVLTAPPFQPPHPALCEMVGMRECHSHTYTRTQRQAEAGTHTADTVRCVILTHTDVPSETSSYVYIIAHNYAPLTDPYAYTPQADKL